MYLDLHCDTLSAMLFSRRAGTPDDIVANSLHIDFAKLARGRCGLQVFALFVNTQASLHPLCDILAQIELFYQTLDAHPDKFSHIQSGGDFRRACAAGRIATALSLEDATVCEKDFSVLSVLRRLGVCMVSLTWNHENALAAPRGVAGGLTDLGRDFVAYAQNLGVVVDVSHLSDRGVYDILSLTKAPIIASHSNCRTLCPHPRNLTDDMIRKIAECGGVIGLNLYPPFLMQDADDAGFDAVCRHAMHLYRIGGEDCLALGTDFDGFGCNPSIPDASAMASLPDYLLKCGIPPSAIEKLLWKNAWRVLATAL